MSTTITCIVFGIFIIYAFSFGVKVGQNIALNQKTNIKSPLELIKDKKDEYVSSKKEKEISREEEINLHNIEIYDGTGLGQQDFK